MLYDKKTKPALDSETGLVYIMDCSSLIESYSVSLHEAAWRGDKVEIEMRLKQIRACLVESMKTFREIA